MAFFQYRPYYKYIGPSWTNPYARELTEEEVQENLEAFFNEVENEFLGVESVVMRRNENVLEVTADITQNDCDDRVKEALMRYELFSQRVTASDYEDNQNSEFE